MTSSFLTAITTIAEVGALLGLLWQLILGRRESKARFMIEVYNDHEDKLNRTLEDRTRLGAYARKRGITRGQARDKILATIDINDAFKNYMIYKGKLVGIDLGQRFMIDVGDLFEQEQIQNRWNEIKQLYPKDFQDFIDSKSI